MKEYVSFEEIEKFLALELSIEEIEKMECKRFMNLSDLFNCYYDLKLILRMLEKYRTKEWTFDKLKKYIQYYCFEFIPYIEEEVYEDAVITSIKSRIYDLLLHDAVGEYSGSINTIYDSFRDASLYLLKERLLVLNYLYENKEYIRAIYINFNEQGKFIIYINDIDKVYVAVKIKDKYVDPYFHLDKDETFVELEESFHIDMILELMENKYHHYHYDQEEYLDIIESKL